MAFHGAKNDLVPIGGQQALVEALKNLANYVRFSVLPDRDKELRASRDPHPSQEDILITQRLGAAGEIIGIPLVDHVIVGANSHHSYREAGLLAADN
jgi:hypothetical protein